ncbi:MAG TPA: hypothetical protein VM390_02070, partial [Acidimicrobiales bacterium]|nr:hypothetical protein [Acidimicrobiales bacterium]
LPPAGMPGPFGLADREVTRRQLVEAGWLDIDITPLDAPMWVGADAPEAWEFVAGMGIVRGLTAELDEITRRGRSTRCGRSSWRTSHPRAC